MESQWYMAQNIQQRNILKIQLWTMQCNKNECEDNINRHPMICIDMNKYFYIKNNTYNYIYTTKWFFSLKKSNNHLAMFKCVYICPWRIIILHHKLFGCELAIQIQTFFWIWWPVTYLQFWSYHSRWTGSIVSILGLFYILEGFLPRWPSCIVAGYHRHWCWRPISNTGI